MRAEPTSTSRAVATGAKHSISVLALQLVALLLAASSVWSAPPARADFHGPGEEGQWRAWRTDDGLPQNTVTSIAQDLDGYLWLGTQEGLARFDGLRFSVFDHSNTPEIKHNLINALVVDTGGSLWIGTRRGLTRYHDDSFTHFSSADGLPDEVVQALALDSFDRLWIGTRNGLCLWDGSTLTTFTTADGLPNNSTQSLWLDPQGRLWVGTEGGLARLEPYGPQHFTPYTTADGLSDDLVLSIGPGLDGEIWVGTMNGGVNRVDEGSLEWVGVEPALAERIVFAFARDNLGALWLGTRNGLIRRFGREPALDGGSEESPEETVLALFADRQGQLWTGTAKGGLRLFEDSRQALPPVSQSSPVRIESIRVGRRSVPARGDLELGRGPTDIEFHFTAIEFRQPRRMRFWHRLEGFDEQWIDNGAQRFASYTNLPPGDYTFHLSAFLPQSDDPLGTTSLALRIPPRVIDTKLFKLAVILALIGLGRLLFSLRVRHLLARRRQLEAVVEERTQEIHRRRDHLSETNHRLELANRQLRLSNQELKALSREKADFLAIAAHDLRAPLVNLKGFSGELRLALGSGTEALGPALENLPPELRERVHKALENDLPEALSFIDSAAARMDTLIGPVLKLSRLSRRELEPRAIETRKLVLEVVESLSLYRREQGATIRVGLLPELYADEDSLLEIFTQLLDNALRYLEPDRAGKIEVLHQEKGGRTIFHVRDNGRGIPEEQRAKVFRIFGRGGLPDSPGEGMGLVYVRTLIQRHGGRIWYESSGGKGSIFSFVLGDPEKSNLSS